jgi:hypothetical protein
MNSSSIQITSPLRPRLLAELNVRGRIEGDAKTRTFIGAQAPVSVNAITLDGVQGNRKLAGRQVASPSLSLALAEFAIAWDGAPCLPFDYCKFLLSFPSCSGRIRSAERAVPTHLSFHNLRTFFQPDRCGQPGAI